MDKIKQLLLQSDSAEKYLPGNFNFEREEARALQLARIISEKTGMHAEVEDPSLFQDGSIFAAIPIIGHNGELPGQVLLSRFGKLATTTEVTSSDLSAVLNIATELCGYNFIAEKFLNFTYDGKFSKFSNLTWFERYFSAFY